MNRMIIRSVVIVIPFAICLFIFWCFTQFNVTSKKRDINEKDIEMTLNQLNDRLGVIEEKLMKIKPFPKMKILNSTIRKRILVTGGAGFVGSHLVDRLMQMGHEVIVVDNFYTGRKRNIEHWSRHVNFEIINHDIINPLFIEVDEIYHLASPASPPQYMFNAVKTIKTNTLGTINVLGLAKRLKAKILMASTSEVYGDPKEHPQSENYWGNVNPIGPRACYDEGKRVTETLAYAYARQENVSIRVARIFNTFGPRMLMTDGRVISNFILQSLQNEDITIYGNGSQTRSFQYISDLIDGLTALMDSNYTDPINLGNPKEYTIYELAVIIMNLIGNINPLRHYPAVIDDPQKRKPDIQRAISILKWQPKISLENGLKKTIDYFRRELLQLPQKTNNLT